MLGRAIDLARPLLFALDPEHAHELALKALEFGVYPYGPAASDPRLGQTVFGLDFPNPLGIAAGFDKDARVPDAILGAGFGFAEIGSVTPKPQTGNPAPRVFRLIRDHAVINRLGFNNQGHAAALARLGRRARAGIVGVNIGANKDTADRVGDYVAGIRAFYDVASYFSANISSPNTPGLRDLQAPAALDELLGRVMAAREELARARGRTVPIVVKIAPDISEDDVAPVVARLVANGCDAIAVSNTTLARTGLADRATAREAGGLSGRPLFERSTIMLARVHRETGGKVPLIGIGGIDSPATALAKIEAGATLIQLYTGLIYQGLGLATAITSGLAAAVEQARAHNIAALVGTKAATWAAKPLTG